jgi:hypothetical protein
MLQSGQLAAGPVSGQDGFIQLHPPGTGPAEVAEQFSVGVKQQIQQIQRAEPPLGRLGSSRNDSGPSRTGRVSIPSDRASAYSARGLLPARRRRVAGPTLGTRKW